CAPDRIALRHAPSIAPAAGTCRTAARQPGSAGRRRGNVGPAWQSFAHGTDGWDATLARDARMNARGIIVLHFSPSRLRNEPAPAAAEIRSALEAGRQRGPLGIRAVAC